MSATKTIYSTNNYDLFIEDTDNRPTSLEDHRALEKLMEKHEFIPDFPIVCRKVKGGKLKIKDGQHRFAFARKLGLTVWYTITDVEVDTAELNCTGKPWKLRDFADKYAAQGNTHYQELIEFADGYGISIGLAASMLYGAVSFNVMKPRFQAGDFTVTDRKFADRCAFVYQQLGALASCLKNMRCLNAIMGACRVAEFDPPRLIQNAKRCREKLVGYSNQDAYLTMLETVYNFNQKKLLPLQILATQAMRARNPKTRGDSEAA